MKSSQFIYFLVENVVKNDKFCSQVISARSFPALYWDKFVKKRVRQKFSEQFEFDAISNILGMEKSAIQQGQEEKTGVLQL